MKNIKKKAKVLVVDDEAVIRDSLRDWLSDVGHQVLTAENGYQALEIIEKEKPGIAIVDLVMPGMDGIELLKRAKQISPNTEVIIITAYGSIKQAVEALKAGAEDYVVKPFDVEELKIIVAQGLEKKKLKEENILLKRDLKQKYSFENIIGKSKAMQEVYSLIEKISATDSTVLITGESGTGKELAARAIHLLSRRRDSPFVSINCAALPEELLESELFGHVKGSFTGAVSDKKGMFEVAQKGVLFLDEVGETSPWTQVKLLRAIQEKKIRRVGGTEEIPVDVWIMAATNLDLKRRIEEGKFREELFYRLNVLTFEMPPLRKRVDDIPLLVNHFLQKYCQQMGKKMKRIAPEVVNLFEGYAWPGNVRELENVMERIVAIEARETITASSLPKEILNPSQKKEPRIKLQPGFNLTDHIDEISRKYINEAHLASGGNLKKTASFLGISYRSLRYLMDKYELKSLRKAELRESQGEYKQPA